MRSLKDALHGEDRNLYKLVNILSELSLLLSHQIPRELGTSSGINIYGEKQLKLDVWANDLFTRKLIRTGLVNQVGSEELDKPVESKRGEFTVAIDPIDGSSNLKSDNLVGTIVGVYHGQRLPAKGRNLLASMYFLYGPYIQLVLGLRDAVYVFAATGREPGTAKFVSTGEPWRIPEKPTVYGIGGLRDKWTPRVREFVETLEKRRFQLRYGGCFIGDFNQVLNKGGFFAYPEMVDAPLGKYRLQFESNPVGFITERAGGKASTGTQPILDVEPTQISQRVPTYLGSSELVQEFEDLLRNRASCSSKH